MVLNLGHTVPTVGIPVDGGKRLMKLSGIIDYAAWVVPKSEHRTSCSPTQSTQLMFLCRLSPPHLISRAY
jgi:hypothetical protein